MPEYKYTATGTDGKTYKGKMSAPDRLSLVEALQEENKFLTDCSEVVQKTKTSSKKLKKKTVADFCRQLGTLLNAGVSLVRSLNIIAEEENLKPHVRAAYIEVLKTIRKGVPLSDAMEMLAPTFPELLINTIRSAEATGSIDRAATKMAVHYEKETRINSKIKGAMVYPIILVVMMVVILIFVCAYILPQFSDLFSTMTLPLITRIIMGISDAIVNKWYLIIILAVMAIAVIKMLLSIPAIKKGFDRLKLRLPVVGKLLRTIYTARFARTLSSLYSSGVSITVSVNAAAQTVGNTYIAEQFEDAVKHLHQGGTLADSIKMISGFENKLSASIKVGEETGKLDEMLDVTADSYDYESEQAINRLVTMVEPVMLIVMGGMVAAVMLGILLPIFGSYNEIAQQGTTY